MSTNQTTDLIGVGASTTRGNSLDKYYGIRLSGTYTPDLSKPIDLASLNNQKVYKGCDQYNPAREQINGQCYPTCPPGWTSSTSSDGNMYCNQACISGYSADPSSATCQKTTTRSWQTLYVHPCSAYGRSEEKNGNCGYWHDWTFQCCAYACNWHCWWVGCGNDTCYRTATASEWGQPGAGWNVTQSYESRLQCNAGYSVNRSSCQQNCPSSDSGINLSSSDDNTCYYQYTRQTPIRRVGKPDTLFTNQGQYLPG